MYMVQIVSKSSCHKQNFQKNRAIRELKSVHQIKHSFNHSSISCLEWQDFFFNPFSSISAKGLSANLLNISIFTISLLSKLCCVLLGTAKSKLISQNSILPCSMLIQPGLVKIKRILSIVSVTKNLWQIL